MSNLTIMDIAREAGVSKATVSRVMNNSGAVSPKTRERVLDIIAANKYSPSATARNLSKGTSSAIGFVVPEIDNPFFGELLRGVTEIIDKNNLTLICYNTDDDAEKDRRALELLKENRVRGILYTPAIDYSTRGERKRLAKVFQEMDVPVILMDRNIGLPNVDGVYFDDYQGMYDATTALIKAGHTEIGIINASMDRVLARGRQKGYLDALQHAGIHPQEEYMFFGNYRATRAYELSKELLAMEHRPTAVLTCNNRTSLGFLKAVHERGESVPEDITCIGLDRIDILDIIGNPFNFIERDARKMGQAAVELLISRMAFPDRPKMEIVLDTRLVIKKL